MRCRAASLLVLALVAACAATHPVGPAESPPDDGPVEVSLDGTDLVVRRDTKIRPGEYRIEDSDGDGVIHVVAPGVTLDLTGVTLIGNAEGDPRGPAGYGGVGVRVEGAPDARVVGGEIRGYKIAVRVRDSDGTVLDGIGVSGNFRQRLGSTVEREDLRDWLRPHDNDHGEWEAKYGAGISVTDSTGVTVRNCRARDGQNGLLLTRSDGARVYDNDFSFLSGWGVALYRTSDSVVARNRLDWCVRGYSHGVYDRGQDSAGILVFEQCSRNVFALNSATHCGDGFFLYAGEETLHRTGAGGCNGNVIYDNDFSHAVANGIEATFSSENVFRSNRIEDCRHAVWAGYSSRSQVTGNFILDCDSGVSIEHGRENSIIGNTIAGNGVGVHLWWDEDADLAATAFGRANDLSSSENMVSKNDFVGNGLDVRLRGDAGSPLLANRVVGDALKLEDDRPEGREVVTATNQDIGADERIVWSYVPDGLASIPPPPGDVHGRYTPPPAARPRGRKYILVDDWGPVDPATTRLFPARVNAGGEARFSVVGPPGEFRVVALDEGFTAEPRSGTVPGSVVVRRAEGTASGIGTFSLGVEAGDGRHGATGSLFTTEWDVRFFRWTADPREDVPAWNALLAGEPVERRALASLDFDWRDGAVSDAVGADGFATLATTGFELDAGRYELRTVSDDGIRVWVDGDLVVDDWTHHGPTPHDRILKLDAGSHTIRVEHFELTGWAVLRVTLVRF